MNPAPRNTVILGDAREQLRRLPESSVDCVVTSPPYFLLRDYGVATQIGLEDNVNAWVAELRTVMAAVRRVLKPTGSLWLNLGDSYSRHLRYGAPPKSLLLGPERLVTALVEDGFILRSKCVWAKPNPLPSSVSDRLNTTWEPFYFLTKSPHYFFELDAIRVPHRSSRGPSSDETPLPTKRPDWAGPLAGSQSGLGRLKAVGMPGHVLGKNPGDVWTIATAGFRGRHFATFPPKLVERPILASCPERVCRKCGSPWQRERPESAKQQSAERGENQLGFGGRELATSERAELRPTCSCKAGFVPGLVLDPFFGAGTVGIVAEQHGRDWLGIELNRDYASLARARIADARRAPGEGQRRAG